MEKHSTDLSDYLAVLRRRKAQLIIPAVLIFLVAVGFAYGLPPIYQATATILIEQQEIPQDLVKSTITSYASEQIQLITKRVMTRENLLGIIKKYNLYPEERNAKDTSEIVSRMAKDIDIKMINADVEDPGSGRSGRATIAFDITFDSRDPRAALTVVKDLVRLYLSENTRIRTQKATQTTDFLGEEANRLNKQIQDLEAKLAAYKEKNVGKMPELMQMNMALLQSSERDLEATRRDIASLEERKVYLESQLAQLQPNTGDSPAGQLRKLQLQYLSESAIYEPNHPDLVRLRRQIAALRQQVGLNDDTSDLQAQYLKVKSELDAAKQKYSDQHPEVIKLKKTLAALSEELNTAKEKSDNSAIPDIKPDNPAYVSTQTQLEEAKISLKAAEEKSRRLQEKMAMYQSRLEQMPKIEQDVTGLKRSYDNAVAKYNDIKQKQLQARVAQQLEEENRGERFSLLEPPYVPSTPDKPNRIGILLLGIVLSFGGGITFASLSEYLDQTVRGAKSIMTLVGAPLLAAIPYIKNKEDARRKRNRIVFVCGSSVGLLALGLVLVHIFIMPLDALWSGGLMKMGWG